MTDFIQVTTTVDTKEGAQKIAEILVKSRLAACVHVSGPISSTYWWQGKLEVAEEWVCTAKTRKELYGALEKALQTAHPYAVPEILALPILDGSQSYLDWLLAETTRQ
ncbi:MAG: divalent-cation tolerance protein CutA [Chloroflexi bacterium]|nr:MAG: divalent-cation tolerance protein CutA [Chloroflexota bacterium]